ncbi:MAG TPA: class I SAM-dependent methyltransferase [Acidimicrobiales bacterium]|nr:class I SAM-dependent methyltransferase [Acidimicrobiales bacterium]
MGVYEEEDGVATTSSIEVHPANEGQARAWDGDEGEYWAAHADWFETALAGYDPALLAAAAIEAGHAVLDLGCGTGVTTRAAARAAGPGGEALGIDLSSQMVAEGRRRAEAEGLANARFVHGDAQIYPFPEGRFDVVVSRTAAMFFGDPVAALANAGRALRPGGRLVLLTWQGPAPNEWLVEWATALTGGRGLPAPPPGAPGQHFADAGGVGQGEGAGFGDVTVEGVAAPFWAGPDPETAFGLILGQAAWMSEGLSDEEKARAHDALRASLEAHATAGGVVYRSGAWLTTARRP